MSPGLLNSVMKRSPVGARESPSANCNLVPSWYTHPVVEFAPPKVEVSWAFVEQA